MSEGDTFILVLCLVALAALAVIIDWIAEHEERKRAKISAEERLDDWENTF